jgi:GntR family transcriptional repressor for pyruvate dehydrogenase complex
LPITPVTRRSLPEAVFEQLAADIVAGDLAPGEPLPSERALAEALGVSRPAVREALTRLAQAGLVDIRQGESTIVRDYQRSGSLDLLPRLLLDERGELRLPVARAVIEARRAIGPEVSRLAAERASPALADRLDAVVDEMADTTDVVALQRHAHAFWDAVVDGTDNVVYRLLFNALARAYEPVMDALATLMRAEVSDLPSFRTVAAAVRAGDGGTAAEATRHIIGHGTDGALAAIATLTADDDREADR